MNDEYEYALNYVLWGRWDDLFTLMLRSRDDFLCKKIQLFLNAYYFSPQETTIIESHDNLLIYLDHAMKTDQHNIQILKI